MGKFTERLINNVAYCDSKVCNKIGKRLRWEGKNGYVANGLYYRMQERLKAFDATRYTEEDLRGLSKAEKEFVRDNEYKCYVDNKGNKRIYFFIAKNATTGKKQLYGQSKRQLISPNGHDVSKDKYNYACWLILRPHGFTPFDSFHYEVRSWQSLPPVII